MATLGCSKHVAYIQSKCAGPRLCELLDLTSVSYDRRLDDISEASVEIPISGDSDNPCCACLKDVWPMCHVLTIVREGDGVVWTGPVTRVIYGYNAVRIEAKDKLQWLVRRVNEIPVDFDPNPPPSPAIQLTTIAKTICEVAMAEDDSSCFLDCILDLGDGLPSDADRSIFFAAFEGPTAYDDLTVLAGAGMDFTVVNQCLILGPEKLPTNSIGTLLDEHILGEVSVIKDGDLLANRVFVRYEGDDDCAGVCAPASPVPCVAPDYQPCCPCPAVAPIEDETEWGCYGLIETIITDSGMKTFGMAQTSALTFQEASRNLPILLELPSPTQLSPDTPWAINDMIPGQRVDVALAKLCFPVHQSFKLQQVSVEDSAEGESISIDLKALDLVLGESGSELG